MIVHSEDRHMVTCIPCKPFSRSCRAASLVSACLVESDPSLPLACGPGRAEEVAAAQDGLCQGVLRGLGQHQDPRSADLCSRVLEALDCVEDPNWHAGHQTIAQTAGFGPEHVPSAWHASVTICVKLDTGLCNLPQLLGKCSVCCESACGSSRCLSTDHVHPEFELCVALHGLQACSTSQIDTASFCMA